MIHFILSFLKYTLTVGIQTDNATVAFYSTSQTYNFSEGIQTIYTFIPFLVVRRISAQNAKRVK